MKVETSSVPPKFNLLNADGTRSQAHSEEITDVLLNDGRWYGIEKGSFKFYRTGGDKSVPFIQFKVPRWNGGGSTPNPPTMNGKTIEVFPASVVGIAYRENEDDDSIDVLG